MKFWIQSFLLGVPKIIVGFRSRDGILQRAEEFDVESIPATVAQRGRQWDGNVCINFAAEFLDCEYYHFLSVELSPRWKAVCEAGSARSLTILLGLRSKIDDEGIWRIRRRPRDARIEVIKTREDTGHGRILTDEFINHRIKLSLPKMDSSADADKEQGTEAAPA